MKVTGHIGIFKAKEDFLYLDLTVKKDSIICCGIVADYRVSGYIWKGWHLDSEDIEDFNNRNKWFYKSKFISYGRNQMYLDWNKLERITSC